MPSFTVTESKPFPCPRCKGTGHKGPFVVSGGKCHRCRGAKVVTTKRRTCDECGAAVPMSAPSHVCNGVRVANQ